MESNNTEEILCSNCGRPNLQEAVKCWYCQTPLEKEVEESESAQVLAEPQTDDRAANNPQEETHTENAQTDIPEWLKRVRELKQQDQSEDEEEDQWQQQGLFGNSATKHGARAKKKKESGSSQSKQKRSANTVKTTSSKPKTTLEINQKTEEKASQPEPPEKIEAGAENQPEDLPDGFVKFDSKNG